MVPPRVRAPGGTGTLQLLFRLTDSKLECLESVVRSVEPLPVPKRDVLGVDVHPIIEWLVDSVSHVNLPDKPVEKFRPGAFDRKLAVGVIWNSHPSRS